MYLAKEKTRTLFKFSVGFALNTGINQLKDGIICKQ